VGDPSPKYFSPRDTLGRKIHIILMLREV